MIKVYQGNNTYEDNSIGWKTKLTCFESLFWLLGRKAPLGGRPALLTLPFCNKVEDMTFTQSWGNSTAGIGTSFWKKVFALKTWTNTKMVYHAHVNNLCLPLSLLYRSVFGAKKMKRKKKKHKKIINWTTVDVNNHMKI